MATHRAVHVPTAHAGFELVDVEETLYFTVQTGVRAMVEGRALHPGGHP